MVASRYENSSDKTSNYVGISVCNNPWDNGQHRKYVVAQQVIGKCVGPVSSRYRVLCQQYKGYVPVSHPAAKPTRE